MPQSHQDQIFQVILEGEDVTWQTLLYDLVKTEQMDPWDIDIGLLANKFLLMLKKLKEMDFRISGNVLLAAAVMLKLKTKRLLETDLVELDKLIAGTEDVSEEEFYDELEEDYAEGGKVSLEDHRLIPRIPQPRKRKVSIYDLVGALEKALEVKRRRVERFIPELQVEVPEKKVEMTRLIRDIYNRIRTFVSINRGKTLTFSQLIPSPNKEDKVLTLIPLLHLCNQRRVDLEQKEHFGEIEILLRTKRMVGKELQQGSAESEKP